MMQPQQSNDNQTNHKATKATIKHQSNQNTTKSTKANIKQAEL